MKKKRVKGSRRHSKCIEASCELLREVVAEHDRLNHPDGQACAGTRLLILAEVCVSIGIDTRMFDDDRFVEDLQNEISVIEEHVV